MRRIALVYGLLSMATVAVAQGQLVFQAVDENGLVLGNVAYMAGAQSPPNVDGAYAVADIGGQDALFAVPNWDSTLNRFERASIRFETPDCTGQAFVDRGGQGTAAQTYFTGPLLAVYRVQDARDFSISIGSTLIQNGGVCVSGSGQFTVHPVELVSSSFLSSFSGPFHLEPVQAPAVALPVPAVSTWGLALLVILLSWQAVSFLRLSSKPSSRAA